MKLIEQIETRERELNDLRAQIELVSSDVLDSQERFDNRVSHCERSIAQSRAVIADHEERIQRELKHIESMRANRNEGLGRIKTLNVQCAQLERECMALRILIAQAELEALQDADTVTS